MIKEFDREYWLTQLKKEVGLESVEYDQLVNHEISTSGFFKIPGETKNAKQYVDEQLEIIENSYKDMVDSSEISDESLTLPLPNVDDLMKTLNDISEFHSDSKPSMDLLDGIPQLRMVEQQIQKSSIRYFYTTVDKNDFIVAINTGSSDFRISDQINHIINTSFFVEELNPLTMTGNEGNIISYYQFVNYIQPFLKQNTDLSAYEKIMNGTTTVFDGLKLDKF